LHLQVGFLGPETLALHEPPRAVAEEHEEVHTVGDLVAETHGNLFNELQHIAVRRGLAHLELRRVVRFELRVVSAHPGVAVLSRTRDLPTSGLNGLAQVLGHGMHGASATHHRPPIHSMRRSAMNVRTTSTSTTSQTAKARTNGAHRMPNVQPRAVRNAS